MKATAILGLMLALGPAMAGQMYEWRDPQTGKLMLGDKPPAGVDHWKEGERKPGEYDLSRSRKQAADEETERKHLAREAVEREKKDQAGTTERVATQDEIDACIVLLKRDYEFKDPESIRLQGASTTTEFPSGKKIVRLQVNAKNSYGAYAGAKQTICTYEAGGKTSVLSL